MLSRRFFCFLFGCIWVVNNLYLHLVVIWKTLLLFKTMQIIIFLDNSYSFHIFLANSFFYSSKPRAQYRLDSVQHFIHFYLPTPLALWPLLMSSESITHIAILNKLTLCIFSGFYLCFYHSILLSLLHLSLSLYCSLSLNSSFLLIHSVSNELISILIPLQ